MFLSEFCHTGGQPGENEVASFIQCGPRGFVIRRDVVTQQLDRQAIMIIDQQPLQPVQICGEKVDLTKG